jgi:uncharacterized SAM-dependent methyltransferase
LGIGSGEKKRTLVQLLHASTHMPITCYGLDISPGAIETSRTNVLQANPSEGAAIVTYEGICAEFFAALETLATRRLAEEPLALFFLGTTLGDYDHIDEAIRFMSEVQKRLSSGDRFILAVDMDKLTCLVSSDRGFLENGPHVDLLSPVPFELMGRQVL